MPRGCLMFISRDLDSAQIRFKMAGWKENDFFFNEDLDIIFDILDQDNDFQTVIDETSKNVSKVLKVKRLFSNVLKCVLFTYYILHINVIL